MLQNLCDASFSFLTMNNFVSRGMWQANLRSITVWKCLFILLEQIKENPFIKLQRFKPIWIYFSMFYEKKLSNILEMTRPIQIFLTVNKRSFAKNMLTISITLMFLNSAKKNTHTTLNSIKIQRVFISWSRMKSMLITVMSSFNEKNEKKKINENGSSIEIP